MGCKYEFYKPEEKYCPLLYCNIDNKQCIYSKKCLRLDKFIPLDGEKWKECYKFIMEMQKEIPSGSVFVQLYRPNRKGDLILYVILNDKVEKIQTKLKELKQNYVYVRDGIDGYEVSLTPFPQKSYIKTTSTKRKKQNSFKNDKEEVENVFKYDKETNSLNDYEEKTFSGLIEED